MQLPLTHHCSRRCLAQTFATHVSPIELAAEGGTAVDISAHKVDDSRLHQSATGATPCLMSACDTLLALCEHILASRFPQNIPFSEHLAGCGCTAQTIQQITLYLEGIDHTSYTPSGILVCG